MFGVEGPGSLLDDIGQWWNDEPRRERLLKISRMLEAEPSLIGVSSHAMAIGRRRAQCALYPGAQIVCRRHGMANGRQSITSN